MAVQVKERAHTLSMVKVEFWRMRSFHRMAVPTLTKTKSLLTTPQKELTCFGLPLTNLVTHSVLIILMFKVLSCTLTTQGTWKAWSSTLMTLLQSSLFMVMYWSLLVCLFLCFFPCSWSCFLPQPSCLATAVLLLDHTCYPQGKEPNNEFLGIINGFLYPSVSIKGKNLHIRKAGYIANTFASLLGIRFVISRFHFCTTVIGVYIHPCSGPDLTRETSDI